MGFIRDFKLGVNSYINAVIFIKKYKLWIYFLFPIVIFFVIYYTGFTFQELKRDYTASDDASMIKKVWYFFVSGFFFKTSISKLEILLTNFS